MSTNIALEIGSEIWFESTLAKTQASIEIEK